MAARALSIDGLFWANDVTVELRVSSSDRICCWLPLRARLVWVMIVCNWLMPPPLSKAPRAPNASSTLGAVNVCASGICDPFVRKGPLVGAAVGGWRATKSSPSGVSKWMAAVVPVGSLVFFLIFMVTMALKLWTPMAET